MPPDHADREAVLRAALRQSRWNLALASLLLLSFGGAAAWLAYAVERGVLVREDRVMAEAKGRLAAHRGAIVAEAGDLAAETLPPVTDAFVQQAGQDLPAYLDVLGREGQVLTENLGALLRRKALVHYHEYLARHRAVLREEFPQLSEREALGRLEASFERALDRVLDRYLVDEFGAVTRRLGTAWRAIPPAPPPGPGDPPLPRQLLDAAGDWAELQLTDARAVTARPAAPKHQEQPREE